MDPCPPRVDPRCTPTRGRRAPRLFALSAVLALGGCASGVPESIRHPSTTPVEVSQVQADPGRHLGQRVRWGGTILAVNNREGSTEIAILARPLGRDGAPVSGAAGKGRFLAEIAGFVDPAEYPRERELTLTGVIIGLETRPVGDYPYAYPVVRADSHHLWPERSPHPVYAPTYPWLAPWYHPWYGPFYRPYEGFPGRYWY